MRQRIIVFLKQHPAVLRSLYMTVRFFMNAAGTFIPKQKKILFASFGGRKFDDSPYALYRKICENPRFSDYELVWAFTEPQNHELPKGRTVKIDTPAFFYQLLSSKIWISNSGIDRGIGISKKGRVSVETWHGCPIKRINGEETRGGVLNEELLRKKDYKTIRCAQSEFDLSIFPRVFNADRSTFLLSDLPRNDELVETAPEEIQNIRHRLGIPEEKKIILYMPTYREYWIDADSNIVMKQTISIEKWQKALSDTFVLLVRAHYAVSKSLNIQNHTFCYDVSEYEHVNDLYKVADVMVSDYSSAMVDFSILEKPIFCFAKDYEEYSRQRGFYLDLYKDLPCPVDCDEDVLIERIRDFNRYEEYKAAAAAFHHRFAPYAGEAANKVIEAILDRLKTGDCGDSSIRGDHINEKKSAIPFTTKERTP